MSRYLASLGNNVFLICSSWFLTDSKNIKLNKMAYMMLDTWILSVTIMSAFLLNGETLTVKEIIRQIFPNILGTNWYITCYLLLYSIFPLLNTIINNISQKEHLVYSLVFFILYFGIAFIKNKFFISDIVIFVGVYFITAYIKRYMANLISNRKFNVICLSVSIILLFSLQFAMNYFSFHSHTVLSFLISGSSRLHAHIPSNCTPQIPLQYKKAHAKPTLMNYGNPVCAKYYATNIPSHKHYHESDRCQLWSRILY